VAAPLGQYLARYATRESALAERITERYHGVLIVPAHREPPGFVAQLEAALAAAPGRMLVIVVVNAAAPSAHEHAAEHAELLESLRDVTAQRVSDSPPAWLCRRSTHDLLSIDRATAGFCFDEGDGVGLARRIGCDLALALYARGNLETPWLHCTDADARLARDYFHVTASVPASVTACLLGFWHRPGSDARIDRATALYEIRLRYYVLSLARAGSPYAFHSIGSTLALRADAYAAVRGFPRRLAGEDFYLLNKLSKVGPLWRSPTPVIELESRSSERTRFGTGVAVAELAQAPDLDGAVLYHPRCFELLRVWLSVLRDYAEQADTARLEQSLAAQLGDDHVRVCAVLERLGATAALERARQETRSGPARLRHLYTWFDGFRTLKLVHGLRAAGLESLPWRLALAGSAIALGPEVSSASPDELRLQLLAQERQLPHQIGPTLQN
jgi:hypothetical protein